MSLQDAVTFLEGIELDSVTNVPLAATPEELQRAQLPALLLLSIESLADEIKGFGRTRGSGFTALAFSGGPRTATLFLTHLLLLRSVDDGGAIAETLPEMIEYMDEYFAEIGESVTLDGALSEPVRIEVDPNTYKLGGKLFYGVAFRLMLVVQIG